LISKSSQRLNDREGVLFQPPDATPKVIRDLIRGGSIATRAETSLRIQVRIRSAGHLVRNIAPNVD